MEPSSSQQQETQVTVSPRLEIPDIDPEIIGPAPDELPDASFIANPSDSFRPISLKTCWGEYV